jgi:hypothetical protein
MKKIIFITIIAFGVFTIEAQESTSKLKLQAVNIGFGGFYIDVKGTSEGGGASFFADATFSIGKNLISATYLTGSDIGILRASEFNFHEFGLGYGREWKATNWLRFEGFAGLGYYNQNSDVPEEIPDDNVISFPLRINTKFYFTKKFGMGFNANYSINSLNNNLSVHLIFHYRFN